MSRSRRAALAALTTLAWAVPAANAHAAPWSPGPTFGADAIDGRGDVATTESGVMTAAWIERRAGVRQASVRIQQFAPDGTPRAVHTLGAAFARGAADVAVGRSGTAVVTWVDDNRIGRYVSLGSDGSPSAVRDVASGVDPGSLGVAVDAAGNATFVWAGASAAPSGRSVFTRRASANSVLSAPAEVQETGSQPEPRVAVSPDGVARLLWSAPGPSWAQEAVWVARIGASGALDGAPVAVSTTSSQASAPAISASAGGAVATWFENQGSSIEVRGVRLPSTGDVAGTNLSVATGDSGRLLGGTATIAADGTVTAVWSEMSDVAEAGILRSRQFRPDGSATPPRTLSENPPRNTLELLPAAAAAPDGTVFVAAMRLTPTNDAPRLDAVAWRVAADGTPGPATMLGETSLSGYSMSPPPIAADGLGGAIAGWYGGGSLAPTFTTSLYDGMPPALTDVRIPESVVVGADAAFSVTATDRAGIADYAWEFGNGSGARGASVSHVYGRAGSYPITLTVTDRSGNPAVVRRTLTVTAPVTPPPPPAPAPRTPPKAAAGLKLGSVARTGAKVTVRGTISRRASGRVTISWSQKVGRRTIVKTATARIAKGRFAVTLRLSRALARARGKATVTLRYAGDADTRAARAQRTVGAPKRAAARR